jgi:Tfp pilus assembly major pilin PilA
MFCSSCGSENSEASVFCGKCGKSLVASDHPGAGQEKSHLEYLEAMIGPKNVDYYLRKFKGFASGHGFVSWNWPAFFVSLIWLLYRKMWAYAAAYFVLPIIPYLVLLAFANETFATAGGLVFNVALSFVVFPMFANALYYRAVEKKIKKAKAQGTDRKQQLLALAREGGTSKAAFIFLLVPFIGMLAAIAIPAYQDYTIRAQISEGLTLASVAKTAVVETFLTADQMPADWSQAGLAPDLADTSGPYVQSIEIVDGRVDITYGNQANSIIAGEVLSITPYIEERDENDLYVLWRCGYAPIPATATHEVTEYQAGTLEEKYLPSACRH